MDMYSSILLVQLLACSSLLINKLQLLKGVVVGL